MKVGLYKCPIIFLSVLICLSGCTSAHKQPAIFPGDTWQRSTPEAQGVDSNMLLDAFKLLDLPRSAVNSMVVIRNGYIIAEYYRQPYTKETRQMINSSTKSFTSALMGIAIDEGIVKSTHERVMKYFPDYSNDDPRAQKMTIEDLLTMRSGLQWNSWELPLSDPNNDWNIVLRQEDWLAYIFSKPFVREPGEAFNYNTGDTQLVADIIHRATGGHFIEYAREKLFEPLGIRSWAWKKTPAGSPVGGAYLVMKTEDLARLGYLYLNEGMWNGEQLVPKQWVRASVKPHTQILAGSYKNMNFHYGYQWWLLDENSYSAMGARGQYCFVRPDKNLVIAVNSYEQRGPEVKRTLAMMQKEIPNACILEEPLPADAENTKAITEYIAAAEKARPLGLFMSADSIKEKLNNKRIIFDDDKTALKSITLTFKDNREISAEFSYLYNDGTNSKIKLDFNPAGEFRERTYDSSNPWIYGDKKIQQYYRISSIEENAITYEIIEPGIQNWEYAVTLTVNENNVAFRDYTHYFGVGKPDCFVITGRIEE